MPTIKCKHCKLVFYAKRQPYQHKCLAYNGARVTRNLRVKFRNCKAKHKGACILKVPNREVLSLRKEPISAFSCERCFKSFSQKWCLSRHLRAHFQEKPFSCGICRKTFSQSGNLRRHLKVHVSVKTKPFKCEVCSTAFSTKFNFFRHTRNAHKGKPDNICSESIEVKKKLSLKLGLKNTV